MKASLRIVALAALVLLLAVAGQAREVREYTNELEVVDHLDLSNTASDELPSHSDSMMETESAHTETTEQDDGPHFSMESEAEADADEDFGIPTTFVEAVATEDIDTDVMRAMALEIHDWARANLDEEGEVTMMEVAAESEAEAETEAEAEAELDVEGDDTTGLSPAEIAQVKADAEAEAKAKAEEAKDLSEAKQDAKEAKKDAAVVAAAATVLASPAGAAATATQAKKEAAPAATEAKKEAAATETAKTVVQLPEDLSEEHARTIKSNEAATRTVQGALGEVNAILAAKDNTIRSLVANITYLTVNVGKLANKVDLQKAYIGLLSKKLALANLKNKELKDHVEHSADTVVSIRNQLKTVEERLNTQDKTTALLADFLNKNADKSELPTLPDDLVIKGQPVVVPKVALRRSPRAAAIAVNPRLRPVEGTQTFADAHVAAAVPFVPANFFPSSYYTPSASPANFFPPGLNIPTIVVERSDSGN